MARITLMDRLVPRKPAAPQQPPKPPTTATSPQPAGAKPIKPPAPKQPKASSAGKVPGVNAKTSGDNSAETFNNAPPTPQTGRPMKNLKQPLMKALSDAQKHKIMTEVNQNLGQKNKASNDPVLQATGHEQEAKYGKPGDAGPPMPTAITQVKKPALPPPSLPSVHDKTVNLKIGGDKTAPLTISSNKTAALTNGSKTPTGTAVQPVDANRTGTAGSTPSVTPAVRPKPQAGDPKRIKQMAAVNTELGYSHIKSPDEHRQALGRHLLSQASTGDKINYHAKKLLGHIRGKMAKNEDLLSNLQKNIEIEDTVKDPPVAPTSIKAKQSKKKKDKYSPKIRVTEAYKNPSRFDIGKFIMGVAGSGSTIGNRVIGAARSAVTKSNLEKEWEVLSKDDKFISQHTDLLKKVNEGSIDATTLARLLKGN